MRCPRAGKDRRGKRKLKTGKKPGGKPKKLTASQACEAKNQDGDRGRHAGELYRKKKKDLKKEPEGGAPISQRGKKRPSRSEREHR